MARVHNFNAGPAALPEAVLRRAQEEMLDFQGSGMSIMEHSHRGKEYEAVHNQAISLLRELLAVGDSHEVLFLQGGASQQFALVPMNFLGQGKSADYVLTDGWAEKALEEAKRVGTAREAANVKGKIPKSSELARDEKAAYLHLTSNGTLSGTQWHWWPETGSVPLVADMSSDFLSRKLDASKFSMIYAGAQKNVGPAGVVIVVAKKDFIASGRKDLPTIFRYETHAKNNSLYNTVPTFGVYMVRNVLEWTKQQGGLDAVEKLNQQKAGLLYALIDRHADYYRSPVERDSRSNMNVVFRLPNEQLDDKFVAEAKKAGMIGLKGHRSVGGLRASIYNAVPLASVQALGQFMEQFIKDNG